MTTQMNETNKMNWLLLPLRKSLVNNNNNNLVILSESNCMELRAADGAYDFYKTHKFVNSMAIYDFIFDATSLCLCDCACICRFACYLFCSSFWIGIVLSGFWWPKRSPRLHADPYFSFRSNFSVNSGTVRNRVRQFEKHMVVSSD